MFLGCSLLKDRYLQLLRRLVEDQNFVPQHFAILERPEKDVEERRTQLVKELNVFPIFFPKGRFELISEILERVGRSPELEGPAPESLLGLERVPPTPEPPPQLLKSILGGRCVLFAGAGASLDAGLPRWSELGAQLLEMVAASGAVSDDERAESERKIREGDAYDVFDVVELCRRRSPDLVARVVGLRLDARGRDSLTHELLGEIAFRGAITSNWDNFIERERGNAGVLLPAEIDRLGIDGAKELFDRSGEFPILKIHGSAHDPPSLLIGRDDYKSWMREGSGYREVLLWLLSTYTAFIYGHSLTDPSVLELFAESTRRPDAPHFALTWNEPRGGREELRKRFGIEAINIDGELDQRPAVALLRRLIDLTTS